ncbi:NUDIX hydrolase [Corynebacterium caspium]|uniref:NUDIX hydrolase n=1 Tax=Corynebacterium caspium TaxID=234828 RepID=UPI000379EFF5|nr:NUDIX domain-containing protein [Corynebacterium caspium]WKD59654.1 dihydroneopterin triphosphate pyrophosphatase [Corynebacterium caspium DSM 44850]
MAIPEFIKALRAKVGPEKLWLPGVTVIVVRDVPEGAPIWTTPAVLLVKRADTGEWTPVTGIVDPDEQPHDAAVREVKEETGLDVRIEALLGVGAVGPVTYPNGDVSSYVDTCYRAVLASERDLPRVGDDENTEVGWFEVMQLPKMDPRFRLNCADAVAQLRRPEVFRPRMGYHKRPPR